MAFATYGMVDVLTGIDGAHEAMPGDPLGAAPLSSAIAVRFTTTLMLLAVGACLSARTSWSWLAILQAVVLCGRVISVLRTSSFINSVFDALSVISLILAEARVREHQEDPESMWHVNHIRGISWYGSIGEFPPWADSRSCATAKERGKCSGHLSSPATVENVPNSVERDDSDSTIV
ncbi:hypothetical protein BC832DRAFT_539026 [Gaertneriomyces semiglobifer]|nr:hypothetical protein BC832DRAFT_539026 [Gaertneriomyces semiglobifer]